MAANETLLATIKKLHLVDDRTLRQLPTNTDPKLFVEKGLLTPYQVRMLQKGEGNNLVLGNYIILEKLGEGGMGEVYKARHRKLDRIVALKIIRGELVSSPKNVSRFQREAKAAAKLSSPHIVAIFDADEVNGIHYMAMEYLHGSDLGHLAKKHPLPIAQACDYIRQAALGLQHAHEKGLVHRDIKPANLFLADLESGQIIKVLDFGLSLVEDDKARKTRLTQIGSVMGTVDYMAPEQAADASRADIRSDIYSLGCSLFYLLTGKLAFPDGDPINRLYARMIQEAPSVRAIRPDVPAALDAVMRKMMAKEPANRYQTPGELAVALQPFAKKSIFGKVKRLALASLAVAGVFLVGGVMVLISEFSPSSPTPLNAPNKRTDDKKRDEQIEVTPRFSTLSHWQYAGAKRYCDERELGGLGHADIPDELEANVKDGLVHIWGTKKTNTAGVLGGECGWFGKALIWNLQKPDDLNVFFKINAGNDQGLSCKLFLCEPGPGKLRGKVHLELKKGENTLAIRHVPKESVVAFTINQQTPEARLPLINTNPLTVVIAISVRNSGQKYDIVFTPQHVK